MAVGQTERAHCYVILIMRPWSLSHAVGPLPAPLRKTRPAPSLDIPTVQARATTWNQVLCTQRRHKPCRHPASSSFPASRCPDLLCLNYTRKRRCRDLIQLPLAGSGCQYQHGTAEASSTPLPSLSLSLSPPSQGHANPPLIRFLRGVREAWWERRHLGIKNCRLERVGV